jgi:hypothetical protein
MKWTKWKEKKKKSTEQWLISFHCFFSPFKNPILDNLQLWSLFNYKTSSTTNQQMVIWITIYIESSPKTTQINRIIIRITVLTLHSNFPLTLTELFLLLLLFLPPLLLFHRANNLTRSTKWKSCVPMHSKCKIRGVTVHTSHPHVVVCDGQMSPHPPYTIHLQLDVERVVGRLCIQWKFSFSSSTRSTWMLFINKFHRHYY